MDKELLKRSYFFQELDPSEFAALAEIVQLRRVDADAVLFFEGDPATGFFVLLSGRVRIYKSAPDGKELTLHVITPGQMFAEAAIFRGQTFPANCMAMDDSEVVFIPKEPFLQLITHFPNISLKIIAGLSRWLREFAGKLEDLSLREVSARLAAYLLKQSRRAKSPTVRLSISKAALATELGTISETLSRNLKKLRDLEIIAVDGSTIVIRDQPRLEAAADGEKI